MYKFEKNKDKLRAKNNQKEIYILNTAEDVLKIPEDTFYKIDISNFSGNYFKRIYEEALEVEQGKRKLKKARQLNFNFDLLEEINLDYFKNLEPEEKIEKKEYNEYNEVKIEKKEKIEKKDKEVKNEKKYIKKKSKEYKIKKEGKKEESDKTQTKSSKFISRVKHNKNLNYDSPINHIKNKSFINYNGINIATPDKNKSLLNFDSLNKMKQRNMDYNKNYINFDNNDNYLLKNVIEMMRNRQRIKSEEKNNKLKRHKTEPLEIIFEDNTRKKRVISPEINIKRNFNTKFNKILYNLYNIKTNENNDNNSHNNTLHEENKITYNKSEKSFSTMFNEIKKKQKRKYYFTLLQKKINYLKQINSNNKFNKNNIFINDNNNNNISNSEKYLHFRIKTNSSNIDNNENYKNNFQSYNNTYHTNNNNNFFTSYNENTTNLNDKNDIIDKTSSSTIYKNNTNNSHKISKITFNFKYNSNYGDNIGILGSNEKLGNWCQDKILYLKWNYGNIWSNSINVDNSKLENFEFKYIISHEGTIYWEKGYNYLVDFEGLIDEIQYHKKGRFNKYEFTYKKENSELILHCKWNGWEWDDNNNSN